LESCEKRQLAVCLYDIPSARPSEKLGFRWMDILEMLNRGLRVVNPIDKDKFAPNRTAITSI
jgi:hypothetical protein